MSQFYDRPFRVPVWVIVKDVGPRKTKNLISSVVSLGAFYLKWPAQTFLSTIEHLGKNGWPHVVKQKKPFRLDSQFLAIAMQKHAQLTFGGSTTMTGMLERPYHQALDRTIKDDDSYRDLFEQALLLERDVGLSHLFGLATPRSRVYISEAPVNEQLISRLCDNLITVGEDDSFTVNIKDKKPEEAKELIDKAIESRLNVL